MKQKSRFPAFFIITIAIAAFFLVSCSSPENTEPAKADPVEANIKMYTHVWDEIINKGKLDMFNDSNFTKDVVMHASPTDVVD